jgi:hypothetical protein
MRLVMMCTLSLAVAGLLSAEVTAAPSRVAIHCDMVLVLIAQKVFPGRLTDWFGPFEVHLYRVRNCRP